MYDFTISSAFYTLFMLTICNSPAVCGGKNLWNEWYWEFECL